VRRLLAWVHDVAMARDELAELRDQAVQHAREREVWAEQRRTFTDERATWRWEREAMAADLAILRDELRQATERADALDRASVEPRGGGLYGRYRP
jgi:hypothetical protein